MCILLSDNVRRSSRKQKNINYSEKVASNLSGDENSDKTIENKERVCSPSTKKHHIINNKIFSIDSLSETETDTKVSNDVMLNKKPHQSKRQLNYSSDDETCTDKATIITSYDHLPPPIVNVA